MSKSKKAEDIQSSIGTDVLYVPNGVDLGIRPRGVESVAAKVVNEYEHTIRVKDKDSGEVKDVVRKVVNLLVFDDSAVGMAKKVRIPHKDEALADESFYTEYDSE